MAEDVRKTLTRLRTHLRWGDQRPLIVLGEPDPDITSGGTRRDIWEAQRKRDPDEEKHEQLRQRLGPWLESYQRAAWLPIWEAGDGPSTASSRVEEWRGGEMLRFHSPLIKLDRRFSRIQLSDKASHTFAHEQLALGSLKLDQAQRLVQVRVRIALLPRTLHLELRAQPLTDPLADMRVDASVGFADGPDPEIVGPTAKLGVDPPNLFVDLPPSRPARRQLVDLAAEPLDLLPRRAGAQVRLARPAVIVPPQGITQKVERLRGQAAQARLLLVHRQLSGPFHN